MSRHKLTIDVPKLIKTTFNYHLFTTIHTIYSLKRPLDYTICHIIFIIKGKTANLLGSLLNWLAVYSRALWWKWEIVGFSFVVMKREDGENNEIFVAWKNCWFSNERILLRENWGRWLWLKYDAGNSIWFWQFKFTFYSNFQLLKS